MRQSKKLTVDDCSRICGPVVITWKCIFQLFPPFPSNKTVEMRLLFPVTCPLSNPLPNCDWGQKRYLPFSTLSRGVLPSHPQTYPVGTHSASLAAPVTAAILTLIPVIPILIIGHIFSHQLSATRPVQSPILPLRLLRLARLLPPLHLRFARRPSLRLALALGGLQVLELLGEAFAGQGAVLRTGARSLAFYDGVGGEVLELDGGGGFVLYLLVFWVFEWI